MQAVKKNPALAHLFGAYLNQDWPDEYGSVDEALAAYRKETGEPLRKQAAGELDALLAAGLDDDALAAVLFDLGLEYVFDDDERARDFAEQLRAKVGA